MSSIFLGKERMREALQVFGRTPQEKQVPVFIAGAATLILLLVMLLSGSLKADRDTPETSLLALYCIANGLHTAYFHLRVIPSPRLQMPGVWAFVLVQVTAAALITPLLAAGGEHFLSGLMLLHIISLSAIPRHQPSYVLMGGFTCAIVLLALQQGGGLDSLLYLLGSTAVGAVTVAVLQQLKSLTRRNINRLEMINEFSRQITSSLDTRQVLSLLNATVQNALEADSYFIGLADGSQIHLSLLYDDGEYFNDVRFEMKGTLSGWVIRNQQDLFLPDMRRDVKLADVDTVVAGQDRISLSWMGVPMTGLYVKGVIGIASYQPNAFDRSDLELMNNMARHAALALDNTYRHAQVEEQSRLDSLTRVYNHGYFLQRLQQEVETARLRRLPLSLIMVDIDYFKQFNDSYGHVSGDEVLAEVSKAIVGHIKQSDFVGRWGGEEFAIALPGARGDQAFQVARRIHETLSLIKIRHPEKGEIPSPTLSQGIAEFPAEAAEMMDLVQLADQRLYVAKQRGRNQIEPDPSHWAAIQAALPAGRVELIQPEIP
jgi:diguanylate cyclase (GGDEF)-like protein